MSSRGRGRGKDFGRGKPFSAPDQLNVIPVENIPPVQHISPYPPLDHFPATLSSDSDYENLHIIQNQILSYFQVSNCFLKFDDVNVKLFSSQGEFSKAKKVSFNFDWDYFPLELRPVNKRKLRDEKDILASLRKNKMISVDLSWLDKLEEKEKTDTMELDTVMKEESVDVIKKGTEGDRDDGEEHEEADELFDDEELDGGTDYNTNYFDNGEEYLDEDEDIDEGPYF